MKQRPYQAEGTRFLLDAERAILADEPGVGKTNQLLMAAQGRTLILSPAMLADVWSSETADWRPDLDHDWRSYSKVCRRVAPEPGKPASVVVAAPREDLPTDWDTIICDEAQYLKNRNTTWTKVVRRLRSPRLYLATGTPLPNWGHEIFTSLRLLYPGDRRFTNYWGWVSEYFKTSKPPYGGTRIGGLHRGLEWEEVAQEWGLPGRWLRREFDDVLADIPPMTRQTIHVDMQADQAAVYKRLKKEWWAQLPETGEQVISWSDGGIYSKMLQCSTGLSTLHPDEKGSAKLDLLRDLMRDRGPTILFGVMTNTVEAVAHLLRDLGRNPAVVSSRYPVPARLEEIRRFKAGEYTDLVGTIGTLAEGHTLTRSTTCIFVERSPRPISNYQARQRIRRFGQTRPTLAIDLITRGTVDEKLSKLLEAKETDIDLALTGFQLAAMD